MATLQSFIDIFETPVADGSAEITKIVIPIIQRDYAQGRKTCEVNRVRKNFLDSLYKAVTEKPISFDFVYGDISEDGVLTPLDGQQRLTTLFLLHWYAAKKESVPESEFSFSDRFSYETRYSARDFCKELVKFEPQGEEVLSKQIVNQAWFPLDWLDDPTISSMLTMLDAIQDKFHAVNGLWEKLKDGAITFYFLPIKDMGLTEELYIKMNSRGKPLTTFEHFKVELEEKLRAIDNEAADKISIKIDTLWTDLLWKYKDSGSKTDLDYTVDDEFLRYFNFVCDVISYKNDESPSDRIGDEFDLINKYFSPQCAEAEENLKTLERFFDCWCNIPGFQSPTEFLSSFISNEHACGKILAQENIFGDCLHSYGTRGWAAGSTVLLYAVVVYLLNSSNVSYSDFVIRIRIVNNLILNSSDEIADRQKNNRMHAVLLQTEAIMLTGKIDEKIKNSFNAHQMAEEIEKQSYLEQHPDKAEMLFTLEDHELLYGQIGIIGTENIDYSNRFITLFDCNWDLVNRALMSVGNYGQKENWWRYQYGSQNSKSSWRNLFHRSANDGFDNTHQVLVSLLSTNEHFTDEILEQIVGEYISKCESSKRYPFNYYYIKYSEYRPDCYGKLRNTDVANSPYMYSVLLTKKVWSESSYLPYLKVADSSHLSKDYKGQRLVYPKMYVICYDSHFEFWERSEDGGNDKLLKQLPIPQKEIDGKKYDTVDRIDLLKSELNSYGLI